MSLPDFSDIQAVLFDFDGLILDTEWPIYTSWLRLYQREGQDLPVQMYAQCIGSGFHTWSPEAYLEELTGKEFDWEKENAARQIELEADIETQDLLPGIKQTLIGLKQKGIICAVVSSSSHAWVDRWVSHHQLDEFFLTTVCREDANQIKPAPDLYLEGAKQVGIKPAHCLVIEDSQNGVLAGAEAGMRTVVVPSRLTQHYEFELATMRTSSHLSWLEQLG
ncbi:HAD family hydrolase [Persicirhabdus sediminis]|uniref:HAD family phosphatase n=1 Tax=Persicirhabdus sediminis TaxID=454144 RepID=A0A8J7SFM4_9BACT|nr:HAD family phosphatase [Persicirhabdus sediminis]MBK1789555.1 HAD family phosphatase [Persicirhabdus sediminis]